MRLLVVLPVVLLTAAVAGERRWRCLGLPDLVLAAKGILWSLVNV